jgi:2-dehydropantoate 2-reductase
MARFIIYGAGAIGGVVGGRLKQAQHDVLLIARGAHLDAIRTNGLTIEDADATATLQVAAAANPAEIDWRADDVMLLAVKGQATADLLTGLASIVPASIAIVCMQNGINNEREALRRFPYVYGCMVATPAVHMSPGVVQAFATPLSGILDLGRYPAGVDARAQEIAAAFESAGFSSLALPNVMHWKRRKLISNLTNSLDAITGSHARTSSIAEQAMVEGERCFAAAGLTSASAAEDDERRRVVVRRDIAGKPKVGSSSWQSLARGAQSIETDYLNGEIVLIGRQHGVPTPANLVLQQLARMMAQNGMAPGSIPISRVEELIAAATAAPSELASTAIPDRS